MSAKHRRNLEEQEPQNYPTVDTSERLPEPEQSGNCPDCQTEMKDSKWGECELLECPKCFLTITIHPDQSESWTRHYDAQGQRVVRNLSENQTS